jgi:hypothetical protein
MSLIRLALETDFHGEETRLKRGYFARQLGKHSLTNN